jgi:hypothetical protein
MLATLLMLARLTLVATAVGGLSVFSSLAAAQPAPTLSGVIVDSTGTPVARASVVVRGSSGVVLRTLTGDDGRFAVAGLATGTVRLTVSSPG